jgi:hypothetical protein
MDQAWVVKKICERKPQSEKNVKAQIEINGRCRNDLREFSVKK